MTDTLQPHLIPELAVIEFAGPEAVHFLQGQLTNDTTKIAALAAGELMIAAYCSPKGRMLATMRMYPEGDAIRAIVSRDAVEGLVKRLKMFIMRSKVTVTIVEDVAVAGFTGSRGEALASTEGCRVFALTEPSMTTRIGAALPGGRAIAVVPKTLDLGEPDAAFWCSTIASGDVWISEAVKDAFVPQSVNLELIGGVSFKKGCYTGQEVVSRVEHIGKTPRRAALFICEGTESPAPGTEIMREDGTPAAMTVMSQASNGRVIMLLQVANEDIKAADLVWNTKTLHPLALPYGYERQE